VAKQLEVAERQLLSGAVDHSGCIRLVITGASAAAGQNQAHAAPPAAQPATVAAAAPSANAAGDIPAVHAAAPAAQPAAQTQADATIAMNTDAAAVYDQPRPTTASAEQAREPAAAAAAGAMSAEPAAAGVAANVSAFPLRIYVQHSSRCCLLHHPGTCPAQLSLQCGTQLTC